MKKVIPIVIKDDKETRCIVIQVNLKNNTISVLSSFSPWENLALIMEALAVTSKKCINEEMSKEHVYGAIKKYLMEVLGNYKIIEKKSSKH